MLALPDRNAATNVTAYWLPEGTPYLWSIATDMTGVGGFGDSATGGGIQVYIFNYLWLVKEQVVRMEGRQQ